MIIGAHRLDDETLRIHEYSPGESTAAFAFDHEQFVAHEKFFVEDVRRWTQSRFDVALPADRTAVFGVSASGELALAMGLRHPDIYGAVFCASPGGGYRPPAVMPSSLPRAYLVAGMQERFFLENATRWADALRDAGADVVMAERVGSHGDAFWREELPLMVAWAFGPFRSTAQRTAVRAVTRRGQPPERRVAIGTSAVRGSAIVAACLANPSGHADVELIAARKRESQRLAQLGARTRRGAVYPAQLAVSRHRSKRLPLTTMKDWPGDAVLGIRTLVLNAPSRRTGTDFRRTGSARPTWPSVTA